MITIVDYSVGNLFSLVSSFRAIGCEVKVSKEPEEIWNAGRIILPGVGAFRDAKLKLDESGLEEILLEKAKAGNPIMGVCLGMQMLFDKSYEYGTWDGLGLIEGEIRPISDFVPEGLKIPHMGWNELQFQGNRHPLFKYIKEGDDVYFVHSYSAVNCDEHIIATSEYGGNVTAAVAKDNVLGCQFHPEKSGTVGLKILKAFNEF
ncbi:MAG: imidazole glycerol phosphate synthase subunit HisH [Lachnospiraceae bacterium]|nr:imidazole glycerol phosphate synthase subunit HisH [Lachnospiraceae bacterium]